MKTKTAALIGIVGCAVMLAGATYVSPYWVLHEMHTAIVQKDVRAFSHYVDLSVLRLNLDTQMKAALQGPIHGVAAQMKRSGASDADVNAWRDMLPVDELMHQIGSQVSIESIASIMANEEAAPTWPTEIKPAERDLALSYNGWNKVVFTPKDQPEGHGFVFQRNGLWGWKLIDLNFEMQFTVQ